MGKIGELFQTADWVSEKHVPVIDCPEEVGADQMFDIAVSLGKAIAHPNTTEHHIAWIQLYFKPDEDKFCYQLGNYEFLAHGASVQGPNTGPAYTNHSVVTRVQLKKSGTLFAAALCNIHGLWESMRTIKVK
ncbi:MAG TPA: class II SORL domain-containing protein [Desulfomonilaceae bacterium]|nr:class II SORL domain-containing protein [Desulfomonilaceae bacterium]